MLMLQVRPGVTMMNQLLIMTVTPGLHASRILTWMCLPTPQIFTNLDKGLVFSGTTQMTKVTSQEKILSFITAGTSVWSENTRFKTSNLNKPETVTLKSNKI